MGKHYSYLYLNEDLTPFYAGCGAKKRSRDRHDVTIPPPERRIKWFWDSADEAFAHEMFLIELYGRKDLGKGPLLNLTDGGKGHRNPGVYARTIMREHGKRMVPKLLASMDHHHANHVKWHVKRNITKPDCKHCQEIEKVLER